MRLPFLQVDQKAFASARLLGRLLGMSEHEALGRMCKLWAAVLDLTPEDHPPERMGLVLGEDADLFIGANFEWESPDNPDDFTTLVNSMQMAGFIERHPEGLRLKGLSRYGQVLAKQQKDRERKRGRRTGDVEVTTSNSSAAIPVEFQRTSSGSRSDSAGSRSDSSGVPADSMRQTQTHTQTQKEEEGSAGAPPPSGPDGQASLLEQPAQRTPRAEVLQELWNSHPGLPRWREMPEPRRKAALARLRERPVDGPGGWAEVVARIAASPFCQGSNDRAWRADPDWLLRPGTAARVLEGKYDGPDASTPFQRDAAPGGDVPRL